MQKIRVHDYNYLWNLMKLGMIVATQTEIWPILQHWFCRFVFFDTPEIAIS